MRTARTSGRIEGAARTALAMMLVVAVGCSGEKTVGHEHDDVFRVGLAIGPDEIAAAGHLPITTGVANRIGLNLYNDHGSRITTTDHFQISIAFTPTTLASATQVAGTSTMFDIASSQPPETTGTLMVTIYHPHTEQTKNFGPYDVLIH